MKNLISVLFSFFIISGCFSFNQPESATELQTRGGVSQFIKKARSGNPVTVVYFGGSITEAEGWRVLTSNWMKEYFNNENINAVNAAIGGTTSEFGAFRVARDVAPHEPDLVLVEFAVNDSKRDSIQIIKSMEGIVRQLHDLEKIPDICFIYTLKEEKLDSVMRGKKFLSVRAMEKVADYYNIPSINFGPEVAKRVKNSTLIFESDSIYKDGISVFSKDGIHPYTETGHEIYSGIFIRSMKILEKHEFLEKENILPPLRTDNQEYATMIDISDLKLNGEWNAIVPSNVPFYDQFGAKIPGTIMTSACGSGVSFKFFGTRFGFSDVIGPKSGHLLVEIDNLPHDTINRFDPWCHFYRRHFFLYRELDNGIHNVKITLLDKVIDKKSILRNKKEFEMDSSAYKGTEWYMTNLLLVGELIE